MGLAARYSGMMKGNAMSQHTTTMREEGNLFFSFEIRMRWFFLIAMIILVFLLLESGCDILNPENTEFFFTSFEQEEDAEGWSGVNSEMFVDDAAPGGGNQSLLIGGGCIQPTATLTLPGPRTGGFYTLSCWGKLDPDFNGGHVYLTLSDSGVEGPRVGLRIDRQEWHGYRSNETLYCPPSQSLEIQIMVGGIVYDCMKLDRLTIEKVD